MANVQGWGEGHLSIGMSSSDLCVEQDFGDRDPAFPGDRIEQIYPSVFFEDRGIAQLIYLPVSCAAHRRDKRRVGALPGAFRPEDLGGCAVLPVVPVAGELDSAQQNTLGRLSDLGPEYPELARTLHHRRMAHIGIEQGRAWFEVVHTVFRAVELPRHGQCVGHTVVLEDAHVRPPQYLRLRAEVDAVM